jgi:hypothetical protein
MVELRVIIVKEYSSILEREILTAFPQCNAQVPKQDQEIMVQTTQKYSKVKENPRLSKAIF